MKTLSYRALLAAGALTLASGGALAQVNDPALIAAAQKEHRGMLYTGATPATADRIIKAFQDKYGIELDSQRANSGPLSARFLAEWDTNNVQADVVVSSDEVFSKEAGRKGWYAPIRDLPEAKNWPAAGVTDTTVIVGAVPYPLAWNKNAIPGGLKEWKDLLDPKLKGRIMISDPRIVTTANGFYILMRRTYGDDFLRQLGKQVGGLSGSATPGMQQIAAGAFDVYAPGSYQTYLDLVDKGAPLGMAVVQPTAGSIFTAGLVSRAPHPNIAKLLIRYYMSPEGQTAHNEGSFSMLANVPKTTALPSMVVIDGDDIARERGELIQLLGLN